jgi:hypothetical protein
MEIQAGKTYINRTTNMVATITEVKRGFAVTLIDADSEQIVATRVYNPNAEQQANAYAKFLVQAV